MQELWARVDLSAERIGIPALTSGGLVWAKGIGIALTCASREE
jgi:hypothetical protein